MTRDSKKSELTETGTDDDHFERRAAAQVLEGIPFVARVFEVRRGGRDDCILRLKGGERELSTRQSAKVR